MAIEKFLDPKDFGKGKFLGDDPTILELTDQERLFISAHRHACPNPLATVDYYKKELENVFPPEEIESLALEMTRKRYDECDFVFSTWICEFAKEHNKKLYNKLTRTYKRNHEEPVGNYEEGRIPISHLEEVSPLSSLTGYALPRIFIEIAGRGLERTQEKYFEALNTLEKLVKVSKTKEELLSRLSEEALNMGVDSEIILSHTLAYGILREENNFTEIDKIADSLTYFAPKLWQSYKSLSLVKRFNAGILTYL